MLLAPIVWILTILLVVIFAGKFWWFPAAINQHGMAYDQQFHLTLIITGIIFFLAQMALGWVIVRYRDDGGRAHYSHGNNRLEALWTTATTVLFIGLVFMGTRIWAAVHFDPAPPDAMKIQVFAKQFHWYFRYPGADGKFGRTDIHYINDSINNSFGIDDKDPDGKDDITVDVLRVPIHKPILLLMRSQDVIHNFFVRELRLKQDIVPGMEIPFHFQADEIGTYEVPCSELCGQGHHQMRTTLLVLSEADFGKWLKEQAASRQ